MASKKIKSKDKFKFGQDFQELILRYTVTDPAGFKALAFYEDSYFTLIYHGVIAFALKKYYKKNKRVPEQAYLKETLRVLYQSDKVFNLNLTEEDRSDINNIVEQIYSKPVSEPEPILRKIVDFSRYVRFKAELENVDINNFDSYEAAIQKFKAANNIGVELENNNGTFLVKGMNDRAHKRDISHLVNPTPFTQMNQLLNSGGLARGSVIVIMSKEKRFKSGFLINTARGYLARKKKVAYVDLENGENAIVVRSEQSISNQSQEVITSGDYDEKLVKMFRKYARLGAEMVIKKFPSLKTSTNDLQTWFDTLKRDHNFAPDVLICDYGLLLASTSGTTEEFTRISEAHLDLKNFADHNNLESVWSAAHITREANKRTGSKYLSTDIAKCIDIPKHIDGLWGLQESDEEMEAGVMRLEMIEQRGGVREGNAMFWVDIARQRLREFNKSEIKEYRKQSQGQNQGYRDINNDTPKKPRKSDM